MRDIVLIDFEASCLPQFGKSYPIEVALARTDGQSRAWLIYPLPKWRNWDWSDEAEALHRISREMLDRKGLPAELVLAEMAEFAADCDVYADADLDAFWLELLAHGVGRKPPFAVRYLGEWMVERGFTRPQVVTALDAAKRREPREHFARDDARRLALVARILEENAAPLKA
ncbi:hypothetical protein [Novosphingobium colocasiae]|uniref:Exonuclease domain-containing protein n=1 Tax=Novosphingobium colocasiae TaxID=1256513 RepID=A0A918P9E8_9SPHN|nr:hypothetical protein [Novosphingobium colocasiae]GGY92132.1 hypothetical protein GCM10011614_03580 [Novosphingobium colocasiae]